MQHTIPFDDLVSTLRKDAPGRVTVLTYEGLKFALECGIDCWEYWDSITFQAVIRDHGTPEQKQRLKEEIIASTWGSEINKSAGK